MNSVAAIHVKLSCNGSARRWHRKTAIHAAVTVKRLCLHNNASCTHNGKCRSLLCNNTNNTHSCHMHSSVMLTLPKSHLRNSTNTHIHHPPCHHYSIHQPRHTHAGVNSHSKECRCDSPSATALSFYELHKLCLTWKLSEAVPIDLGLIWHWSSPSWVPQHRHTHDCIVGSLHSLHLGHLPHSTPTTASTSSYIH